MTNLNGDHTVRTGELTEKIWHRFGAGYIKLTQVRAATGHFDANTADMMVMGEWPSTGNLLHGFEVKISRADWLNEVKNPHKNDSVKKYCDHWWLVIADENMVRPGELPDDWGMMVYDGPGRKLRVVKKAPLRESAPMDHVFVASLLRHNEKDTITMDLHNEQIRDERFAAKALEKQKNDDLYQFLREIGKGFGIKLSELREDDWSKPREGKRYRKWYAEIKNTILGRMDAARLAVYLSSVRQYDEMISHAEWAVKNMKEIRAKMPDEKIETATGYDESSRIRVWLDWAISDGEKVIENRVTADPEVENV